VTEFNQLELGEGGETPAVLSFLKFPVCSTEVEGRLKGDFEVGKEKAETHLLFFITSTQLLCDLADVEFAEEYMHGCRIQICI